MRKVLSDGLNFTATVVGVKYIVIADDIWIYILFLLLTILSGGFLIKNLKERLN